jgi:hypothetical protein
MTQSALRLIKRVAEFQPQERIESIPTNRRGLYVLYKHAEEDGEDHYDVVYVGMATRGMKRRLRSHLKRKGDLWTHFSAFEVWDNVRDEEIVELEGLFRHIYRKDSGANALNVQRNFKKVAKVRDNNLEEWN